MLFSVNNASETFEIRVDSICWVLKISCAFNISVGSHSVRIFRVRFVSKVRLIQSDFSQEVGNVKAKISQYLNSNTKSYSLSTGSSGFSSFKFITISSMKLVFSSKCIFLLPLSPFFLDLAISLWENIPYSM